MVVHGTVVHESPQQKGEILLSRHLVTGLGAVQSWDSLGTVQSWDGAVLGQFWTRAVLVRHILGTLVLGQ